MMHSLHTWFVSWNSSHLWHPLLSRKQFFAFDSSLFNPAFCFSCWPRPCSFFCGIDNLCTRYNVRWQWTNGVPSSWAVIYSRQSSFSIRIHAVFYLFGGSWVASWQARLTFVSFLFPCWSVQPSGHRLYQLTKQCTRPSFGYPSCS